MSDSNHNDTYTVVTAGGSKLKGHAKQSGGDLALSSSTLSVNLITTNPQHLEVHVWQTVKVIKDPATFTLAAPRYFANGSSSLASSATTGTP